MDPWCGNVDIPENLEANATAPMHYVVCIDNGNIVVAHNFKVLFTISICYIFFRAIITYADMGMRDVTARYASKFLSSETRALRVDSSWWIDTLKVYYLCWVFRDLFDLSC